MSEIFEFFQKICMSFGALEFVWGGAQISLLYHQAVSDFNARGVRVLLAYNPWDQGTRDSGVPDQQSMAHAMAAVNAR